MGGGHLPPIRTPAYFDFALRHAPGRGVPAYTQSTQLRTLIFECQKNENVLNREKCNKNMPHPG